MQTEHMFLTNSCIRIKGLFRASKTGLSLFLKSYPVFFSAGHLKENLCNSSLCTGFICDVCFVIVCYSSLLLLITILMTLNIWE